MPLPSQNLPTFIDLYQAYTLCSRQKKAAAQQIRFESQLEKNLLLLHRSIHQGDYRPLPATCFVVHIPKIREIFAPHFRDRIVHHLIRVRAIGPQ